MPLALVLPRLALWFCLFLPTAPSNGGGLPVLVFFHGDGFAFLSAASAGYDEGPANCEFQQPHLADEGPIRYPQQSAGFSTHLRVPEDAEHCWNTLPAAASSSSMLRLCAVSPTPRCSTESMHPPLYWKVTNPTLSVEHLQDLSGFTSSVYRRDHVVITKESYVFSPNWVNTLGAYLITPVMGSHFSMYLAKMQGPIFNEFTLLHKHR